MYGNTKVHAVSEITFIFQEADECRQTMSTRLIACVVVVVLCQLVCVFFIITAHGKDVKAAEEMRKLIERLVLCANESSTVYHFFEFPMTRRNAKFRCSF